MENFHDMQSLVALLNPKKSFDDSSDDDEDDGEILPSSSRRYEKAVGGTGSDEPARDGERPKARPYDKIVEPIVDREDVTQSDQAEVVASSDWRKSPRWNVSYKQQVTASDIYLQMGGKTPSTASCEDMILTIEMPGERFKSIDIKLTKESFDLTSPMYKLSVPLPHPVDVQKGDAKWDQAKESLMVTLRMDREFDYVNF